MSLQLVLKSIFSERLFLDQEIEHSTYLDMILIVGSFLFILTLLCIQTHSFFLGVCGLASIVGSFAMANLIYRYVVGFVYFGVCHLLSVFVILGIGADDVFVFVDTWRQSGVTSKHQFSTLAHRLSHVYSQAAIATMQTSLTTIIAFLASALSPILAISSFGVFSALLVLLTYVSVIIFFPTAIILSHSVITYSMKDDCCEGSSSSMSKSKKRENDNQDSGMRRNATEIIDMEDVGKENGAFQANGHVPRKRNYSNSMDYSNGMTPLDSPKTNFSNGGTFRNSDQSLVLTVPRLIHVRENPSADVDTSQTQFTEVTENTQTKPIPWMTDYKNGFNCNATSGCCISNPKTKFDLCVRFFRGPLFRFLTHRVYRWIILGFFCVLTMSAGYFNSKLLPEDREIKLLKSDTDIMTANTLRINNFMAAPPDASVVVRLIWGLKHQDLSDCRFREDDDCAGRLRLDPTFNINSAAAQLGIRDFCRRLNDPSETMVKDLRLRLNTVTGRPKLKCFMLDFETYLERMGLSLPLNKTNVLPFMKMHSRLYNMSGLNSNFNNYFEVMLNFWLTDGYSMSDKTALLEYGDYLGERRNSDTRALEFGPLKTHWGGALVYMIMSIETDLNQYILGYPQGFKVAEAWDAYMDEQMKMLSNTTNKAFPEARKWRGLAISEALANNAWQGIVIGIATSLFIITCTTTNIFVSAIATLSIGLVTVCVIACIVLADWRLGPLESINMCLVVGLSVDYIVHLAEAYNRSLHSDRINRMRDALEQVGVSVLSGAITTLGSSVFMMFANIVFFKQFGIFMFSTIGLSFLFAIGFFCTFMGALGPEGTVGSLSACGSRKVLTLKQESVHPVNR